MNFSSKMTTFVIGNGRLSTQTIIFGIENFTPFHTALFLMSKVQKIIKIFWILRLKFWIFENFRIFVWVQATGFWRKLHPVFKITRDITRHVTNFMSKISVKITVKTHTRCRKILMCFWVFWSTTVKFKYPIFWKFTISVKRILIVPKFPS